jgi:hypothetical protein
MNFLVLSILCISVNFISNFELEEDFELEEGFELEVSLCVGKIASSKLVRDFCDNFGGTILHRCCRSYDNVTFVAIDLMNANLTEIPDFSEHLSFNFSLIDLRLNDDLVSLHDNDFLALTYLNDLVLPNTTIECPGGARIWEIIENITDPPGIRCQIQKSICTNLTDLCVERDSVCNPNGPNHFLCSCKPGYHGYKCLRYGQFPAALFFGLTAGVTIASSIFLYWTQRRHVKK